MKHSPLLFGAHMSIADGMHMAIERAQSINCTAIQIFTKSNRQWKSKPLNEKSIELFTSTWKNSTIKSIIVHASYLINIGSPDNHLSEKSVIALIDELDRCADLNIPYLILHPGSHTKSDVETCLTTISKNLDRALNMTKGNTMILLETMAGQGSSVCSTFEQIASIINQLQNKKRVGVCLDTCHIFVAGYDFRTKKTYIDTWNQFDAIIGLDKLKAIHINDSKESFNSHIDRHANIGEGKIGIEAFKLLFNDHRFSLIPKILETPKKTLLDDERNINIILNLIKK